MTSSCESLFPPPARVPEGRARERGVFPPPPRAPVGHAQCARAAASSSPLAHLLAIAAALSPMWALPRQELRERAGRRPSRRLVSWPLRLFFQRASTLSRCRFYYELETEQIPSNVVRVPLGKICGKGWPGRGVGCADAACSCVVCVANSNASRESRRRRQRRRCRFRNNPARATFFS